MARPSKLTPATADGICQRLRAGVPRVHAAESMGVDRRTMFLWLQRGHEADVRGLTDCAAEHHGQFAAAPSKAESLTYLQFLHMVTQVEADAVVLAVGYVTRAMSKDWRSVLAWLERRHPAEFKLREQMEVTGADGGPLYVESARESLLMKLDTISKRVLEEAQNARPDGVADSPPP